jgi:hypothetical protein
LSIQHKENTPQWYIIQCVVDLYYGHQGTKRILK